MNHTKYDREAQGVKPVKTWEDKRASEAKDWPVIIASIVFVVVSGLVLNGIADWVVGL